MGKSTKKLSELLAKQAVLREQLSGLEDESRALRVELAKDASAELFKSAGRFAKQFTSGAFLRAFAEVCSCLVTLADHDPKYLTELGTSRPYDTELTPEQKYFVQYLFGGPWTPGASLDQVLTRMADNAKIPGNPLNKGDDK